MIIKAALMDLKLSEVPTILSPDGRSHPSHLNTWQDGWRHLRFLLLHSPKWLFFYPGAIMLALGLLVVLALLPGPLQLTPTTVLDFHPLLAGSFAVLIGTELISFSILARRYAALEGFLPPIRRYPRLIAGLSLERALYVSLIILILGIVSFMSIAVAIQIAATAFFASALTIRSKGCDVRPG